MQGAEGSGSKDPERKTILWNSVTSPFTSVRFCRRVDVARIAKLQIRKLKDGRFIIEEPLKAMKSNFGGSLATMSPARIADAVLSSFFNNSRRCFRPEGFEHGSQFMSQKLLGKKVFAKGKTGEIVRVYTVVSLKDNERVNVKWNDGTISVEMRLSDLQIIDVGPE